MTEVLVLCAANICRSVMAQSLLARRLAAVGELPRVRSAGLLTAGDPAPPEVVSVMRDYDLDVSGHRSRAVGGADIAAADLVLAMARDQVRQVAVMVPEAWPRSFTLKELVRRGEQAGRRAPTEPLAEWLARVHVGRDRLALLGDSAEDDIADPYGGPPRAYAESAAEIDRLLARLVGLCWPQAAHERQDRLTRPGAGPEAPAR